MGLAFLLKIGSKQTGNWTDVNTWLLGGLPTISDNVTINSGHTVTIPSGQNVSAGSLFDKGILRNFGTLQMGNLKPNSTGNDLEIVDYKYKIRGELRGINLDASGNLTNKIFSMKLGFEDAGFFDGNIGKQEWKSNLDNVSRSFTYGYDGASRITQGSYMGAGSENYSLNSVSYDLNGNIKTLSRNGLKSNNSFGLIDNLNYSYNTNSNKILKVDDISNETASFKDVSGNDYTYSLDGSLTSDANKGITSIEYNYLKKPRRIIQNGVEILYQYDALGKKLKETIGSNITDYNGNTIYKNGVLYQISHDEGRIINGEYEYNIKDHLGNLRVAFRDSLGVAKITQSNSYGIWGEILPTLSYLKPLWKEDNFRFTGKENLPETGYIDFGARFYDNIVPRFISIDPMADSSKQYSPFIYGNANPLRFIDRDGKSAVLFGPGDKFKSINAAALDFGKTYNDNSIVAKKEFGSTIFKTKDFEGNAYYTYTKPNEGDIASVRVSGTFEGEKVATIHAHGNYDVRYDNNNFSTTDKSNADYRGVSNFVTTPNGSLQKYDPSSKSVTLLSKGLPSDANDPKRLNNVNVQNLPKNEPTRGILDAIMNYVLIPIGQGASSIRN